MKAAWIEEFGRHELIRVGERPVSERKRGELLIRMRAATLNHHDIYLRRGEAGHICLPVVLGSDGAGEVVDADISSAFVPGDRVAIYSVISCGHCRSCQVNLPHKCRQFGMLGGERDGTHAEYVVIPEGCAVLIPNTLDFIDAAAISLAGLTSWNMVVEEGQARTGEHALVFGASGGVGVFTVLLLKYFGLTVHVVTSDIQKKDALLTLGADTVLEDIPTKVLMHARNLPEGGVDIAFNWVGGDTWRYAPLAVRSGGRILSCGSVRSPVAEIDMRQIFYRNISIIGCSMGTPEALKKLMKLAAEIPKFRVPIEKVISLEQLSDAHQLMEDGSLMGKIIIQINP